jgi:GNAT superfamily N-acetyltransferase
LTDPDTLFPDRALARRLESHEAWSSAAHARTQADLYPQTGAAVLPIAGGCAVYCGQRSPLSWAYGLGLSGPADAGDLDRIEAFYDQRSLPTRVRVCPLADPSLIHLLAERGYSAHGFMSVHVQSLHTAGGPEHREPTFDIQVARPDEAAAWFKLSGAGGDWAEPHGVAFMMVRCLHKPGSRLYLAWRGAQPAAGGGLEVHDGVAALIADGTLPAFRRQGAQTALLRARLSAARDAGCELAVVHTRPGAASQRNVLRAGFQVAYTVVELIGPRRRGAEV